MPTGKPESLEERRSQENFDWETAHWTKEDKRTKPLTQINRMQDPSQQQQDQQQPADCEQFIPLKRIYLNVS